MKQIDSVNYSKPEEVKIYKPQPRVISAFKTYPITDNYTASNGRVYNRSEENIILAKEEVDANKK